MIHQIRYNFKCGVKKQLWKLLVFVVLLIIILMPYISDCIGTAGVLPTYWDFKKYLFNGQAPFSSLESIIFQIPVGWLSLHIIFLFFIGDFPENDLHGFGLICLLKTRSRKTWTVNKLLYCMIQTGIFYVAMSLVLMIMTFCIGSNYSFKQCEQINALFNIPSMSACDDLLYLCIIPFASLLVIALLYTTLMWIFKTVISFIIMNTILVLSAYIYSPVLIGNLTMLQRSSLVMSNSIITPACSLLIDFVLGSLLAVIGVIVIKKKDIVERSHW